MKKTARVAAVLGVAALVLAGCGERPSDNDTSASSDESSIEPGKQYPNFKACMVSDSGGFDDKSFNQTSHDGLENAKARHGIKTAQIESHSDAEYPGNIQALIKQGCDQITTVGYKLGAATEAAAKKNQKVDFAIVDFAYIDEKTGKNVAPPNVKGLTFNTDEPAFLAGYLAAAQTETGKVGTFGGSNIPTVTIFMDGFAAGVAKYNEMNDADVQVVGWDAEEQKGSFTEDFENRSKGQAIAETLLRQGADIIFPVAGPAGIGGLKAARAADALAIGWDTDACVTMPDYCDIMLTSVMKAMDVAVEEAIIESIEGETTNEPYVGTLANDGVALAPYRDFEDEIDDEVLEQIEEFKQQIIDGELKVSN